MSINRYKNMPREIERKFEIMTSDSFLENKKYWPITYIMKSSDGKKMYIGISRDFESRMNQHDQDRNKKNLNQRWVISHSHGNESISYYLESFLIHFGRMNTGIKNINTKIQSGELFKRNSFYKKNDVVLESKKLYKELCEMGIFTNTLEELKHHAFAKLNPDLGFTNKQISIIDKSIEKINNGEIFHISGAAGTGKTAILIKIVNDFTLVNKNPNKVIGVYSASVQNRNTIKKYIELINENDNLIFFDTLNSLEKWKNNSKQEIHLIVDEAQSLSQENYSSKVHIKNKLQNELEWIRKNIKTFTLLFDPDQADYYSDIDVMNNIEENEKIFTLDEQFRIKADKNIFNFFKEFLEIKKTTKQTYDLFEYNIKVYDELPEAINDIKLLDATKINENTKILTPGYNKENQNTWVNGVRMKVNNDDRSKDVLTLGIEKVQNSIRTKGLSLENILVIIDDEVTFEDGEIKVNPKKWISKVTQEISEEERIKKIKSTYYVLLTRATNNLYVYIKDEALRQHFKKMVKNRLNKVERNSEHIDTNII